MTNGFSTPTGYTSSGSNTNWLDALMKSILAFMPQVSAQGRTAYTAETPLLTERQRQMAEVQNAASIKAMQDRAEALASYKDTIVSGFPITTAQAASDLEKEKLFYAVAPIFQGGFGGTPSGGGGGSSAPYQQMYDTAQSNKSIYENYDTELGKSVPKSTAQPAAQPAAPAASSYSPVALPPTSTAGQGYDYEAPVSSDEGYGLGMGSISPVAKSSAGAKTLATEDSDMFKSLKQYLNNYMKNQKWL